MKCLFVPCWIRKRLPHLLNVVNNVRDRVSALARHLVHHLVGLGALRVIECAALLLEGGEILLCDELRNTIAHFLRVRRDLLLTVVRHLTAQCVLLFISKLLDSPNTRAWLHVAGVLLDGVHIDIHVLDHAESGFADLALVAHAQRRVQVDDLVVAGDRALATVQALRNVRILPTLKHNNNQPYRRPSPSPS